MPIVSAHFRCLYIRVFFERDVGGKEAVDELVDVGFGGVVQQVHVERRDQQVETVLPEVALRLTFLCTHAVKFTFSGDAASRYHYSSP